MLHLILIGLVLAFIAIGTLALVFLAVCFFLSPTYAYNSAKAFEDGVQKFIVFVMRRPNRLMQRTKGKRPVGFIGIVPPGRNFFGETVKGTPQALHKDDPRYWELVDQPGATHVAHTEIHTYWFIRMWVRYINNFFDVALVGVRGAYRIHEYVIEKTRYEKREIREGVVQYRILPPPPRSEKPEMSREVRISTFPWAVYIPSAETSDRFSWSLLVVLNLKSFNPWITLHGPESWSQFLNATVTDAVIRRMRRLTMKEVIGLRQNAVGDEAGDEIIEAVYDAEKRIKSVIALELDKSAGHADKDYSGAVQLLAIEPIFRTKADEDAFLREWRAREQAKEERILGDAEAYRESTVVGAVAKEVQKYGTAGENVQRYQALENAAKAGNSIIFDTGSGESTDRNGKTLTAILQELKKNPRRTT